MTACVLVMCLVLVDSVEYWTASFDHATPLRIWMSAIGYSLRPTNIYIVILLLDQGEKKNHWLGIPLVINARLAFSALFTDIAYSYSADNQFVRGPLGYFAFVTSGFYAVVFYYLYLNTQQFKRDPMTKALNRR